MFPDSGSAQHGAGSGSAGKLGQGPGKPGQGSGLQDGDQAQHDRQSSAISPGQISPTITEFNVLKCYYITVMSA